MALSLHRRSEGEVQVDVDDLTIVLALLNLLTQDLAEDDPVLGVADRVTERLRADIASLGSTTATATPSPSRRPPIH